MKKFLAASLASGLMLSVSTVAIATETLILSSWLPPKHPIVADMIKPWIKTVEKESNGELSIKILPKALGAPPAHFDLAKDNVADITYGVHGYQPGRFKLVGVSELPFLGDSSEAASVAYWRTHEKFLAAANEHEGAVLLGLMNHGPGAIYNNVRSINSVADLDGLKFRVGGGVAGTLAKGLNITPLMAPAPKSYEMLANGVADGILFPAESIKSFKLTNYLKYATSVPGGLYNTSFFLVASSKKFNALSKSNQAALMRASGENFARIAGRGWDAADAAGRREMQAKGIEYTQASDSFINEIQQVAAPLEAAWIKLANDNGVDGAAALAYLRAEIAKESND
ncbi:MAG TPA: ABC transporter substrate-binding protein [Oceanospirillaceae bacterium]|nr:ABC transporter substrate-binding protein [Oceanospirillaceae bacterium]